MKGDLFEDENLSFAVNFVFQFITRNKQLISQTKFEDLEFEIRLGTKKKKRFDSSITPEMKENLIETIKECNKWKEKSESTIDYIYNVNRRENRRIKVDLNSQHIIEDKLITQLQKEDKFMKILSNFVRFQIKNEKNLNLNLFDVPEGYVHTREKLRHSFQVHPLWWIDITQISSRDIIYSENQISEKEHPIKFEVKTFFIFFIYFLFFYFFILFLNILFFIFILFFILFLF